eukprot:jgi/Undpi1/7834/HiC_scaffold_23.g10307.m1
MVGPRVPCSLHGQPGELDVGGQVGGLAVGLVRGFGHGGAPGGAGDIGVPSVAVGRTAYDRPDTPGVGRALRGDGRAGNPSSTLGKQINNCHRPHDDIMAQRYDPAVTDDLMSRPASMQTAAGQGYVGDTVDISARVHTMLEILDGIDFLAFVPRGGAGVNPPLSQHLCILGHAIITVATRGFP